MMARNRELSWRSEAEAAEASEALHRDPCANHAPGMQRHRAAFALLTVRTRFKVLRSEKPLELSCI